MRRPRPTSGFCTACGAPLGATKKPESESGPVRPRRRPSTRQTPSNQRVKAKQRKEIAAARSWLLVLGVLELGGTLILAFGLTYAARVSIEPDLLVQEIAIRLIMAGTLLGLWFWARKAPVPSLMIAAAVLGVGVVLTVFAGQLFALGINVFVLLFIVRGLRAGLAQRGVQPEVLA